MADKADNVLVASLEERWKEYRLRSKTCRREFSEEAVHDLRVVARRLLGVLDLARAIEPHPRIQKVRRFLKDQLDDLNDLRDLQVMMVEIEEDLDKLPQLKPIERYLQEREKRLLRKAHKQIQNYQPSALSKRMENIRSALQKQSRDAGFPARWLQAVDIIYGRAAQAQAQIDPGQSATIHRLRLAFKRFRYMAEVVQPLLPSYHATNLKRMHDYQSRMGDIQDVETLLQTVSDFSEKGIPSFDFEPVRRFYEKRHGQLTAAFIEDKGELFAFWRAAPDQSFPWEKDHDPIHHPPRDRRTGGQRRGTGRQPASIDRQGPQEDAQDRARVEGAGSADRPDPD